MSVLFADLVGFTALTEQLDSEDVREIVTECLRRLVAEVDQYDGTVEKFIGDCVMAVWGAPIAHEDDAARALRAAFGMQRAVQVYNQELERQRGLRLSLRIGVQSGEVVAGQRQVGDIRVYSVNGDAVNVAARLQGAAEPGAILVGEATARVAGPSFVFEPVSPLELRNKAQPVWASRLIGLSTEQSSSVQLTPLVGRTEELRVLDGCLQELRRGRGQIAAVIGEPGLGKSRLLAALRQLAFEQLHVAAERWVRCAAFAHEQADSYGLTRTLVRGLCRLGPDEPEETSAARLRQCVEPTAGSETYEVLAQLLGYQLGPPATRRLGGLAPREHQRLVFDSVARLLATLAGDQPLVLELDDLHWADPSSVDLLLELMGLAEQRPLFFCYAFRPDREAPAWVLRERAGRDFPHRYSELFLRPLSEQASVELATRLLQLDELPPGLRGVVERAAGTPLWVEELVRTLIERGLLRLEQGRWQILEDLEQVELPATLQALIVARIDRLGEARPMLQTAAVIGRRFGRRVLESVSDENTQLDEYLLRAQRVDLVRELAVVPEREYGFKHVLTQEAAYSTLLVRRRRELHRRVAETLEELYAERLTELRPVLAHHYLRAEVWDCALEHARLAAEAARERYANREAIAHYSQAILAAERLDLAAAERLALYETRAEVHNILGAFEPAREDYETALALADQFGDLALRARLLGALGMLWGGHKNYLRGLELTRESVAAAELQGDRRLLAAARVRVGVMRLNLAQLAECRQELEAALALHRELEDEPGLAQTLDVLAMAMSLSGEFDRAVEHGQEAITRLQALGDRPTEASSSVTVGLGLGFSGDRSKAEAWIRGALQMYVEMAAPSGEAYAQMALAQMLEPYGAYEQVWQAASAGLRIARQVGHLEWTAGCLAYLGRVHRFCGDLETAQRMHGEMLELARELGTGLWLTLALNEVGENLALAGDLAGAAERYAEALEAGGETVFFVAYVRLSQINLALQADRPAEALELARGYERFAPQYGVFVADAHRAEGEALLRLGRVSEAESVLRRACEAVRALGAEPPHWRARLALGRLLEQRGRPLEAAAEYKKAREILKAVGADLSDLRLQRSFMDSAPLRAARAGLDHARPSDE